MQTKLTHSQKHGIALFVVLGAIILFSLLGLVGSILADKFNSNSGSLVDLRSERMTAIGGLNLTISALQVNPSQTISLLEAFKGDNSKCWVVLPAASSGNPTLATSKASAWTTLSSGADQSAIAVRILGVGNAQPEQVDILLEGHGKGRNGHEFIVQATYRIHGVGIPTPNGTKGPKNALHAQSGLEDVNVGIGVAGGIYSGGTQTTKIQGSGPMTVKGIRVGGDIITNQALTVQENSIIGGNLDLNGASMTFNKNLSVRGGITNWNNSLTVGGSLVIGGGLPSNPISSSLSVGDSLYIGSGSFKSTRDVTVGKWAVFQNSFEVTGGTTTIGGNLYIGSAGSTSNVFSTTINVTGSLFIRNGTLYVNDGLSSISQNALINSGIDMSAGNGSMKVSGQTKLLGGFAGTNNSGTSKLTLTGDAFLSGASQTTYPGSKILLGSSLTMNQAVNSNFGQPNNSNATEWAFISGTSPKTFSYNKGTTSFATCPVGSASTCVARTSDTADVTWPWLATITPTKPSETSLGYSVAEQSLGTASNPVSTISWNNIPSTARTHADWGTLNALYNSACGLSNNASDNPTAAMINCIYDQEKAANKLYSANSGAQGYLLIHISSWNWNIGLGSTSIAARVRVFFEFDDPGTNFQLYPGDLGSKQIVELCGTPGTLNTPSGTFYGFVQVHANSQVKLQPGTNSRWFGSLEVDGGGSVRTQGGSLSISNLDQASLDLFQDIANAFSTGNASTEVVHFNGDDGTTVTSSTGSVELTDNWIQFERLGEFR